MKTCRLCKQTLEFSFFVKKKSSKDGYENACRTCSNELKLEWAHKNKEKRDAARKLRYENDPTPFLQRSKKWFDRNTGYKRAHGSIRRKGKVLATPPWVNMKELAVIYDNCPEGHHVDHIVPLKHNLVCGLHVPWNLQYLTAKENLQKGNRFDG